MVEELIVAQQAIPVLCTYINDRVRGLSYDVTKIAKEVVNVINYSEAKTTINL